MKAAYNSLAVLTNPEINTMKTITIRKNSMGTYDIYINKVLIEGGFFSRSAAEQTAAALANQ